MRELSTTPKNEIESALEAIRTYTKNNAHTTSLHYIADFLGMESYAKELNLISKIQNIRGYMPYELALHREATAKHMQSLCESIYNPEDYTIVKQLFAAR